MILELPPMIDRPWRFLLTLSEQFNRDRVLIRASGLAYSSLLATVPLVATLFALFSAFGAFDDVKEKVQEFLFGQFLPARQDEIVAYVNEFTEAAGTLGLIGFIVLIFTSILLLDNIESNFNDLWHAKQRRSYISKLTSYTSVLVFGTLFLGASLSISAKLKTALYTGSILDRSFINKVGDKIIPLLLTLAGILVMYLIVPYARVKLRSAALGALVAGILWEVGKHIFAVSVGQSVRYSTIYGSLAAFPIFLIWLYITWVIILLGLEFAYCHQYFEVLDRERARKDGSGPSRISLALHSYAVIAQRFFDGAAPPTVQELAELLKLPVERVETGVSRLVEVGLARTSPTRTEGDQIFPARPLDQVKIAEVVDTFLEEEELEAGSDLDTAVGEILSMYQEAGDEALGDQTMRDLVEHLSKT